MPTCNLCEGPSHRHISNHNKGHKQKHDAMGLFLDIHFVLDPEFSQLVHFYIHTADKEGAIRVNSELWQNFPKPHASGNLLEKLKLWYMGPTKPMAGLGP